MLAALGRAGLADFRANPAQLAHEMRGPTHKAGTAPAEGRAVNAQGGTLGHFAQTFMAAMFAFLGTRDTGLNTQLVAFVGHDSSSSGLSASLEELHCPLMLFGLSARRKRPQVPVFARPRILLARIKPIFARLEFADHVRTSFG
jgi:hypothetical protein